MFKTISKEKAEELIVERKGDANFLILDVRTPEEFSAGAVPSAKNINLYSPNFQAEIDKLDKKKTYLVYCRSAYRSGVALEIMRQLGFSDVYELEGGVEGFS